MNPLKKLAGQTAIYGLSSIVGRFLNYLLVPIYTREFIPHEYGIVTELYAYVALLIVILLLGMETAFFRYTKSEESKETVYSTTLWTVSGSSILFLLLALFYSTNIAAVLNIPQNPEYIIWFAFVIALDAIVSVPFARLREENKARRFAFIKFFGIGVNIALVLFFIVFCKTVYEAGEGTFYGLVEKIYHPQLGIGYIFIANLIASAVTGLMLFPQIIKTNFRFDPLLWKKMMIYGLPLLVLGFAGIINETLDRVLLDHFLSGTPEERKAQIGIYGAAYKLSIIMTLAIQAFRYAAEPFFFAEAKKENAKQTYADIMKYFVIIMSLIYLGTLMYLDIVKYFIGSAYFSGLKVVPVLLLANLFLGVYYNLSVWYKVTDKTIFGAFISVGGALITIALNILWIPLFGYLGSAWATLVCYFTMCLVSWWFGQKHYAVKYEMKKILSYIFFAVVIYLLSIYIKTNEEWINLLVNTCFLLGYTGVVYLIERRKYKAA